MTNHTYTSAWKDDEVRALREVADKFFATEVVAHLARWENQHFVDREVWLKAGELGLLCCSIPEEYGGGGGTFAHDLAVFEAQATAGDTAFGIGVHFCMGSRLAEMQLRVLWEEILRRYRSVEVVAPPKRVRSNFVKGYASLPVQLHPW